MFEESWLEWAVFAAVVGIALLVDLLVANRGDREPRFRAALAWSCVWISTALAFNGFVYWRLGLEPAVNFFTAYLVEESLSIDNLFVFLAIFGYFRIPASYQRRVLFWGVLTAIILRGLFIFGGTMLLKYFHWMFYVFGLFLIFTAWKLLRSHDEEVDPGKNPLIRFAQKHFRFTSELHGHAFFVKEAGRWSATPLVLVLIAIEFTDVLFATDSVPAVLGISDDVFIIYSSNIFAILGLRSLYFVLAKLLVQIRFLNYGLAGVLAFIGLKMTLSDFFHVPVLASLGVIGGLLAVSVIASLVVAHRHPAPTPPQADGEAATPPPVLP